MPCRWLRRLALSAAVCTALAAPAAAQPASMTPFSAETQRTLADRALKSPRLAEFVKAGRARVLRVTAEEVDKDGTPRTMAAAVVVSYATGRAVRALIAPATGEVEDVQPLAGRPQSSLEERQEGEQLLRGDAGAKPLIAGGARLQGGFVVDPPEGRPPGRYLEFHLASPDGTTFVAEAIVDLAAGQVVRLRRAGEEGGAK
jgi:hypothetical protein